MNTEILNQTYLFAIYFICGVIIGIFFDLFRILRKSFKTPDIITYIEDIIFGILTGIFLIFIIFVFNNGELRFYIFLALILGLSIYLLTISKYFIKFNVKILTNRKYILKTRFLFAMPLHTPSQRCPFCFAKVPISQRKSAYFATQKHGFCKA